MRKCRQALLNTYVFAFYVNKNNQTDIFEDNQRDLELATEKLSAYLEQELDLDDDVFEMKRKVVIFSRRDIVFLLKIVLI